MRRLLIGAALGLLIVMGALVVSIAAFGGSSSEADRLARRHADHWAINEISKRFHESMSKKDIDLMMSLWAPNATLTLPGRIAVGKRKIRRFWLTKSDAFHPANRWLSETPAYKTRITADGDRGTLHFECHYINLENRTVVVYLTADQDVSRIDGEWLIADMVVGKALLRP